MSSQFAKIVIAEADRGTVQFDAFVRKGCTPTREMRNTLRQLVELKSDVKAGVAMDRADAAAAVNLADAIEVLAEKAQHGRFVSAVVALSSKIGHKGLLVANLGVPLTLAGFYFGLSLPRLSPLMSVLIVAAIVLLSVFMMALTAGTILANHGVNRRRVALAVGLMIAPIAWFAFLLFGAGTVALTPYFAMIVFMSNGIVGAAMFLTTQQASGDSDDDGLFDKSLFDEGLLRDPERGYEDPFNL